MRSWNRVGRGVLVVAVMCVLAMPVQAAPSEDWGSWLRQKRERVVKMLKRAGGTITSLGDLMVDPRP
jgi:hypothetical protein